MPRHSRIEAKELVYYISYEGKDSKYIFQDDQDRLYFINLLKQQKIKGKLSFYGYVLLPNQYVCLLETNKNNLCQTMHLLNSHYVNYYNRRHKRRNKLCRDRYKCFIVDKKNHLVEVSRYLHSLPRITGVAKSLDRYKWSSFPGYIREDRRDGWIDYEGILSNFDGNNQKASLAYKKYVNQRVLKQINSPFENLKKGIILGSKDFKKEVYQKHLLSANDPPGNDEVLARKIIEAVNQSPSWSLLKNRRKRLRIKNLPHKAAIYFLKKYTDLNNQEISCFFESLNKSSIAQMSRRFNLAKQKSNGVKEVADALDKEIKEVFLRKV